MQVYKKILSTALAASMTLSAVPVTAVGEAEEITATPTAVEETAEVNLPPAEETEEREEAAVQAEEQDETQSVQADATDSDCFIFDTSTGYITGFQNLPEDGKVTVPAAITVDGTDYTVKGLNNKNGFNNVVLTNANSVKSLDLSLCQKQSESENFVFYIGEHAFEGCTNLESVTFPEKVPYTIKTQAFYYCSGITELNFKGECQSIEFRAFDGCSSLSGELDLTNCLSIDQYTFTSSNIIPVISTKATYVSSLAFKSDIPYIKISATSEDNLVNFCKYIPEDYYDTDAKIWINDFYRIAEIENVTDNIPAGISYDTESVLKTLNDKSNTYYIQVSSTSQYTPFEGYETVDSYNIKLTSVSKYVKYTTGCENFPVTLSLDSSRYKEDKSYYLSTDTSVQPTTKLTFSQNGNNYTASATFNLGYDDNGNDIAVVTEKPKPSDESWFIFDEKTQRITGFNTDATDFDGSKIMFPETITVDGIIYTVNGIGNGGTLKNADKVSSIDFSLCTNLETIGDNAFLDCTALKYVNLPTAKGISYTIGQNAFNGCSSIEGGIDLSNCTSVGMKAFKGCSSLVSVLWPTDTEGMKIVPVQCFEECSSLTSFNKTDNVNDFGGITAINYSAFLNSGLTGKVSFPNCKTIGVDVFKGCGGITDEIDLSKCNSVNDGAFEGCGNIESVLWPTEYTSDNGTMKNISDKCFKDCTKLKYFNKTDDVAFNLAGIKKIGSNAFNNCIKIESVDLSDCESIGEYAFSGCSNLTEVIWPAETMSTISKDCFSSCDKLVNFNKTDDMAFNLSGIKSIEMLAFSKCSSITSVDLSDCESIGAYAFAYCSNLTDVIWSTETMPTVTGNCFIGCSKLVNFNKTDDIAFNLDGITEIEYGAFATCSGITGVVDLTDCESIGAYAFASCTNAKPVVSTNTKTIGEKAFSDYSDTTKGPLYVTVVADSEDDLKEYCKNIKQSEKDPNTNEELSELAGFYDVKKIAVLKDAGVYSAPADIYDSFNSEDGTNSMSTDVTYYIGVSKDEGYVSCDGYTNLNAFTDIALKTAANGEERTGVLTDTSLDSFPVSFVVSPEQYNENKKFYLSTDQNSEPTTELALEKKGKNYYVSQSFDLNIEDFSDELAVLRLDPYVEITGSDNLTVGEQATYTARVAPASFAQNVVWSSDNEEVLAFADDSSGNAATKGVGTATITATSADDETLYATRTVTVNSVSSADSNGGNGANSASNNPTTGDSAGLLAALGAGMAALGLGALSLKKKRKEEE